MRMLTLWQPWGSLVFTPYKADETRGFRYPNSRIGERIVIHAAASKINLRLITDGLEAICYMTFGSNWVNTLPRGCALGSVILGDPRPTEGANPDECNRICGDWTPGRYAWPLSGHEIFSPPIACKGKQGWGSYPP